MSDWNAAAYHRVSGPQFLWGRRVLAALHLAGDEHVADIGCGTGRLTRELAERLPLGRVVGVDRSESMLAQAARHLAGTRARLVRADAARLPFQCAFDVVFSTATFHWVTNHAALFSGIARTLRPGGRLHAQCGGGDNLALLRTRAAALMTRPEFAQYFAPGWSEPWLYAGAADSEARLAAAGFVEIRAWIEAAPVTFATRDDYRAFVDAVCLRPYFDRLPPELRQSFSSALVDAALTDAPPLTLDYCRLNLVASTPQR